jgi:hypothetical protein
MRPESQAQASDRGCGQPHGRVQAVRRLPHAADRHMIGVREPANGESRNKRDPRQTLFAAAISPSTTKRPTLHLDRSADAILDRLAPIAASSV